MVRLQCKAAVQVPSELSIAKGLSGVYPFILDGLLFYSLPFYLEDATLLLDCISLHRNMYVAWRFDKGRRHDADANPDRKRDCQHK